MNRRELAVVATSIIHRIRDFPPEAVTDLFQALNDIEQKYDLVKPLPDEAITAIEEGEADIKAERYITDEEFHMLFASALTSSEVDAAGKESFADAVARVKKLSGDDQDGFADIIFSLLNEYQYDFSPSSKVS